MVPWAIGSQMKLFRAGPGAPPRPPRRGRSRRCTGVAGSPAWRRSSPAGYEVRGPGDGVRIERNGPRRGQRQRNGRRQRSGRDHQRRPSVRVVTVPPAGPIVRPASGVEPGDPPQAAQSDERGSEQGGASSRGHLGDGERDHRCPAPRRAPWRRSGIAMDAGWSENAGASARLTRPLDGTRRGKVQSSAMVTVRDTPQGPRNHAAALAGRVRFGRFEFDPRASS